MNPLLALLAIAAVSNSFPCAELNGKPFSQLPAPIAEQDFQAVAAVKDFVVLASFEPERVRLLYVRGKDISQAEVPTPQGLDVKLAHLAVGEDETTVIYDRKLAAIIAGRKVINTVSFPGARIRRAQVLESEILWAVDPLPPSWITDQSDNRRPPASSSAGPYPVVMRTNLVGLNPEPVLELPFESSDSDSDHERLRRTLPDLVLTRTGGEFVLFDYAGDVHWRKGAHKKLWPRPNGLRFLYELPEIHAQIEKAKENLQREFEQKQAKEKLDATKRPVPTRQPQPGRFLPAPVFGARGAHRDALLVVLNLVERPARAVLLYEPSRSEPQCFQIPPTLLGTNVGPITENDAAVNDEGLWLLRPFGFFPWEVFLSPTPSEEEQKAEEVPF